MTRPKFDPAKLKERFDTARKQAEKRREGQGLSLDVAASVPSSAVFTRHLMTSLAADVVTGQAGLGGGVALAGLAMAHVMGDATPTLKQRRPSRLRARARGQDLRHGTFRIAISKGSKFR